MNNEHKNENTFTDNKTDFFPGKTFKPIAIFPKCYK